MEKILITGGAGYIGSMLSTKLVNLGYNVTVLDLLKYDKIHCLIYFFIKILNLSGEMQTKRV